MARPSTCRSLCQNPPLTGEDEPASPAQIDGSDTYTPAPAVLHAPTPAPASIPALLLAPAPVDTDAIVRYSEADLQRILRTVLEAKSLAPVPAP